MPELPDIENYVEALRETVLGKTLHEMEMVSPFLLRTVDPQPGEFEGRQLLGVSRLGKRIVLEFTEQRLAVLHLMIAGRLRWRVHGKGVAGRVAMLRLGFAHGDLWLTEASKKKRASLHLLRSVDGLGEFDRGGVEVLETDLSGFRAAMTRENRTLKRALTDPRICAGIGNAYSDEILFAARLSPVRLTSALDEEEITRLYDAARRVLTDWSQRLRDERAGGFPEKVTAFHEAMCVHGRYKEPCRECGRPVQRIRYASRESNYCVECQNAGRLLADRGLSQLMRKDWPRSLEEMEERKERGRAPGSDAG